MREAHRLDPRNAVIRTVLVNTLLDQARRSVDTNWEEAHAAVQEVLAIDPNHAPAKTWQPKLTIANVRIPSLLFSRRRGGFRRKEMWPVH